MSYHQLLLYDCCVIWFNFNWTHWKTICLCVLCVQCPGHNKRSFLSFVNIIWLFYYWWLFVYVVYVHMEREHTFISSKYPKSNTSLYWTLFKHTYQLQKHHTDHTVYQVLYAGKGFFYYYYNRIIFFICISHYPIVII